MQTDINYLHLLSAYADADAVTVSKNHYPHVRVQIVVLGHANAINNHIHIPFICNIYYN
jgi:hypothetical protein